jgi:hypothetical protein
MKNFLFAFALSLMSISVNAETVDLDGTRASWIQGQIVGDQMQELRIQRYSMDGKNDVSQEYQVFLRDAEIASDDATLLLLLDAGTTEVGKHDNEKTLVTNDFDHRNLPVSVSIFGGEFHGSEWMAASSAIPWDSIVQSNAVLEE